MVAIEFIKRGSLLCEYVGEVKAVDEHDRDDTQEFFIMEKDARGRRWAVFSTHYANEARYICGIP